MKLTAEERLRWLAVEQIHGRDVAERCAVVDRGELGEEPDEVLRQLEHSGVIVTLEAGALRLHFEATDRDGKPRSQKLERQIRATLLQRRFDLQAWLAGDHSRGVRRLSGGPSGTLLATSLRRPEPQSRTFYVPDEFADG